MGPEYAVGSRIVVHRPNSLFGEHVFTTPNSIQPALDLRLISSDFPVAITVAMDVTKRRRFPAGYIPHLDLGEGASGYLSPADPEDRIIYPSASYSVGEYQWRSTFIDCDFAESPEPCLPTIDLDLNYHFVVRSSDAKDDVDRYCRNAKEELPKLPTTRMTTPDPVPCN